MYWTPILINKICYKIYSLCKNNPISNYQFTLDRKQSIYVVLNKLLAYNFHSTVYSKLKITPKITPKSSRQSVFIPKK